MEVSHRIDKQSPLKPLFNACFIPALLVIAMIFIQVFDSSFALGINKWGLVPRTKIGLIGIITSPMLHADYAHLFSNTIPFFILSSLLIFTYRTIAIPVFTMLWLWTNALVWISARDGNHIGASGIIYGLSAFIILIGIMRRDIRSLAISFIVIFLYGSFIWGLVPQLFPNKDISWEGHFWGVVTGLVLAIIYKNRGMPITIEVEEADDDDSLDEDDEYWKTPIEEEQEKPTMKVKYYYPDGSKRG